jgi:hypothetical protein
MRMVATLRVSAGCRTVAAIANAFGLALAAVYLWCPVHRFPTARPFHGDRWYNPYASIGTSTSWRKVNLHAHSRAWSGLTNGRGSANDVLRRYQAMGYDASPVSNYQEISSASLATPASLTVYEHGFNVRKAHFLAVAPRAVDWLDYPLLQSRDEEQHRIDRLRATAGFVIMAHPTLRNAFTATELRSLTGYVAMEIGSNAARSLDAWNTALDAGRPVWGVANDDTHDAAARSETGRYWTMVATPSVESTALVSAIAAGRAYAVFGRGGYAEVGLDALTMVGDTLGVELHGAAADLALVGPHGQLLGRVEHAHGAHWVVPCDAAWVRVVVHAPATRLFLEPVLRTENGAMPQLSSAVARAPTFVRRVLALLLLLPGMVPFVTLAGAARARRAPYAFPSGAAKTIT